MTRLGARRTAYALALTALCWSGLVAGASTAAWSAEVPQEQVRQEAAGQQAKTAAPKSRGGQVLKAGWWWAANQPPAETGVVAHPQQSPPNVPAGHLPVGANAGEADKVVAVELVLDAKPGATAKAATVVLTESSASGANFRADAAKIIACPVTDGFWADGSAARWDARPAYDCDAAQVAGVRDAEGTWTFDLIPLADIWLSDGATGSTSFALVEAVDAPESFQVTFAPLAEDGIVFTGAYTASATSTPPAPTATGGSGVVSVDGSGGATGLGGGGGSVSGLSSGSLDSGSLDSGTGGGAPFDAGTAPNDGATVEATGLPGTVTMPVAAPGVVPPWYGGLPKAGFLLVPFALGLAYLAMLALGPDAQPTTTTSRRGVSRALDRLRVAGTQVLAGARQ